jgi:hypothetical protein
MIMEKFYKGVGMFFATVVVLLAMGFPATWFLMMALGILHHRYEVIPALGYWEVYILYISLNMLWGAGKNNATSTRKEY